LDSVKHEKFQLIVVGDAHLADQSDHQRKHPIASVARVKGDADGVAAAVAIDLIEAQFVVGTIRQQHGCPARNGGVGGLGQMLRLGRGEERTKGRDKASLLANALEAVIGAVYVDGGMAAARTFTLQALETQLKTLHREDVATFRQDYKSQLQEWCQRHVQVLPVYKVIEESGPDHQKAFEVTVEIEQQCQGSGKGHSKKIAEQEAAKQALEQLRPATGSG